MNVNDINNSNGSSMSKLEQLARKKAQQRQQKHQHQNINQVNNLAVKEKKLSLKDKLTALKEKKLEPNQQPISKGSTLLQSLKKKKILTNTIQKADETNNTTVVVDNQAPQPKNEYSLSSRIVKSNVNNTATKTNKNENFSKITGLKATNSLLSTKLDNFRRRKQQSELEKNISSLSNNQIPSADQSNNNNNNNNNENDSNDSRSGNLQFNLFMNMNWKKFNELKGKYSASSDSNQSTTINKGQFIPFIQNKNDLTNKNCISITQAIKRRYNDIYSTFEPLDYTKKQKYRQNFMEPSPDDIILEAQSKVFDDMNKKISKLSITKNKNVDDNDTELQLPIKSRILLDIDQYLSSKPKHSNISILGHHLSGKSTLLGRLLMDLNNVDIETIRKIKNLCERNKVEDKHTYLTWLSDDLTTERSLGYSEIIHKHEIYIKNSGKFTFYVNPSKQNVNSELIAQMFNNDIVIMVIDCSPDGFERGFNLNGQTIEYSMLAKMCGCRHIIVVLNKMDTIDWYQDRYNEIVNELKTFYDTFGYSQEDISWIPVSSVTGEGIVNKYTSLDWYRGLPLIELLKKKIKEFSEEEHTILQYKYNNVFGIENNNTSMGVLSRPKNEFCSLSIKDIDVSKNEVTGWIINGCIQAGESIRIYPSYKNFLVDEIKNDVDEKQIGVPGSFVTMKLLSSTSRNEKGLLDNIEIGDFVTSLLSPVILMNSTTVKLEIITVLTKLTLGMKLIINRQMYTNTVKILKLHKVNNKSTMIIECELSRQDTIPYFESGNEKENLIIIRASRTNKIIGLTKLIK